LMSVMPTPSGQSILFQRVLKNPSMSPSCCWWKRNWPRRCIKSPRTAPRSALYPQITSQNPCTWVRPRRGAQIMVVPLASAATQVWPVCKGSLRASRPAAICCVAFSCNGTTITSRARLAY